MLKQRGMMDTCGRAAASESCTGRGSSTSGLGGRAEQAPRYTFGLLQTPRSTADSTGDFSSGGVRPGSPSGEGLAPSRAAKGSRVKPSVPGRGGGMRRCHLRPVYPFLLSCCPLCLGRASKELLQAVLVLRRGQQHLFVLATSFFFFFRSAHRNNSSRSSHFLK